MARVALVGAVSALVLAAAPAGAGAQDPAGIPDLSKMALDRSSVPRGASLEGQGYLDVPGLVATYDRTFTYSVRAQRRSGFGTIDSDVSLLKTPASASRDLADARRAYRNTRAGRAYAGLVAAFFGVDARRVRYGARHDLRVGDEAFTVRVSVKTRKRRVGMVFALVRVDRVVAEVDTLGAPGGLARRTRALLAVAADRVRVGLLPVSTSAPTISGSAAPGAVLHTTSGSWGDATRPTSFTYQWQRCDAQGAACAAIPGATQPAYVIAVADESSTLRIAVTATNAVGSTIAVSTPTLAIP